MVTLWSKIDACLRVTIRGFVRRSFCSNLSKIDACSVIRMFNFVFFVFLVKMNKTYGLEQYSEFTHYLQFRDCEILNENCRICLEEKSRISFDFNSQIFLICNKCTLEFIKITFQKIDSPSFHNKDNPRTTLVFLFFKDNVFEKPFRPNYHHKKIIFENSLSKLFEKNCVLEGQKFQKLCELSSKRFR